MARVVAACLGQSTGEAVPEHSEWTIRTLAGAGGFGVAGFRVIEVELSREDLARFYAIPHVGARRFPDRTPDERRRLFADAFGQLPPRESVPYR